MYGLIGRKLGHSFSAEFFNDKFKREGIENTYQLFPLESIKNFHSLIADHKDLKGLNVTIPYKEEVIRYLDFISPEAKEIGAVNVIKIERNDTEERVLLTGYNTDCIGFESSLMPLFRPDMKQALILGTGGASKAVKYTLDKLGIKATFVSRTHKAGQITYSQLNDKIIKDNLLIINTTPLGMYPDTDSFPLIPYHFLTEKHVCYDLVYNPETTEFMKRSSQNGATVKNGLEMLKLQALAAWDIWSES